MIKEQVSTEELLTGIKHGSDYSRNEFCLIYWDFVQSRAKNRARQKNWYWLFDQSEIDDLTSRVFMTFFEAVVSEKFKYIDDQKLQGYLIRTIFFASTATHDEHKRNSRFQPESSLVDSDDGMSITETISCKEEPDDAELLKCAGVIEEAVSRLNNNRREVIQLLLMGHRVSEICKITGRTESSVSGLKFNAIQDLRSIFCDMGIDLKFFSCMFN